MSNYAMPFVVVNMGMEMIFIIHVRLKAQSVEAAKATSVLNDVVRNLCNPTFLNELFRPQPLYTVTATRDVFSTLSTSSAMHLSTHSMKKLFELMLMGLKYQVTTLHHPMEIISWTLTHIEEARRLVSPEAVAQLDTVHQRITQYCQSLSVGQLARVRQTLLNYCLDRRIKVSLFLDEHKQNTDGTFVIPRLTYIPPAPTNSTPGEIRYYGAAGAAPTRVGFASIHRDLTFPAGIARGSWNPYDPAQRITANGRNMYLDNRDSLAQQEREMPGGGNVAADEAEVRAYKGEVNYLARLIGQGADKRMQGQAIQLSLFDDDGPPPAPAPAPEAVQPRPAAPAPATAPAPVVPPVQPSAPPSAQPPAPSQNAASTTSATPTAANEAAKQEEEEEMARMCRMDPNTVRLQNQRLLDIRTGLETGSNPANGSNGAGNDLLDLMDNI